MSKYGPDYRLLWSVTLFQEEARRIAEIEDVLDRSEQAHWLVSDAFAGTGPIRDLNPTLQHNVFEPETYQATRKLLRKLADDAPSFPNEPRQYWRQRRQPEVLPQQLSLVDLQSAWLDIVKTMDADGYLDAAEQSPCERRPPGIPGRLRSAVHEAHATGRHTMSRPFGTVRRGP